MENLPGRRSWCSQARITIDDQRFIFRYNLHKSMLITAAKKFVLLASGEAERGLRDVFDCEPATPL